MKKQSYFISVNEDNGAVAKYVSGYVVEKVCAGTAVRFGIRKDGKCWTVDELGTGMAVNPGHKFGKRAEALAYVDGEDGQTGKSLVETFAKYLEKHPHTYRATTCALEVMRMRKNPWPHKERQEFIDEHMREFAKMAEQAARDKAGADVKATVAESADVTAITIEPKAAGKKEGTQMEEHIKELEAEVEHLKKKADRWVKRAHEEKAKRIEQEGDGKLQGKVEELEAELKKARKELEEVWKENATLKATQKPKKPTKDAPKPPKPKAKKGEPENAVAVISLESMREWCEERGNMVATQKRDGCPIWVEGETKPHMDELSGMGFRWAPKRKGWYHNVA